VDETNHITLLTDKLAKSMTAVHPSQFLFSTSSPGLASRIKLLDQNYVTMEAFLSDDEDESEFYKEL
jgi:hypothetical protein